MEGLGYLSFQMVSILHKDGGWGNVFIDYYILVVLARWASNLTSNKHTRSRALVGGFS